MEEAVEAAIPPLPPPPLLVGSTTSGGSNGPHRSISLSLDDGLARPKVVTRGISEPSSPPTENPGGELANIAIRHQLRLIRTVSASRLRCASPAPPPLLKVTSSSSLKSLIKRNSSSSVLRSGSDGELTGGGGSGGDDLDVLLDSDSASDNDWNGEEDDDDADDDDIRIGGIPIPASSSLAVGAQDLTPKMGSTARAFATTPSTPTLAAAGAHTKQFLHHHTPMSEQRRRKMLHIAVTGDDDDDDDDIGGERANSSNGAVTTPHRAATSYSASPGDFVFQPSPAIKAARAIREEQGRVEDEGESEGRVIYSCEAGNFDLGGFTIGRRGLVSSPRNRNQARPSLNDGDNFIVLARLGSGNSSAVHKALHVPSMRLVALKALPLYDAERRSQVMRELKILYTNLASITELRTPVYRVDQAQQQCREHLMGKEAIGPPAATGTPKAGEGGGREVIPGSSSKVMVKESSPSLSEQLSRLEVEDDKATAEAQYQMDGSSSSISAIKSASIDGEVKVADQDVDGGGSSNDGNEKEWGRCPYIVSFYDAFADPKHGCLTLVVEYMNGGSLQDLVNRGGCANEDVLAHICYNVLMGLSYLHDRKKIHRDIKPSNLLINSMGFVKIADFGVSRSLDYGSDSADTFIGTLGYMSPERITGQGYSYEADIWGFGLSIVTVALGHFPLNSTSGGGGYWGLVHAVCDSPAPELPETFSETFRSFIRRCLVKTPAERASAHDLLLHPFITSRPSLSTDASGRLSEFPDNREMKIAETEMICHAIAMHLAARKGRGPIVDTCVSTPAKEEGEGDQHGSSQQQILETRIMVERLAMELDLEEEVVAEKLQYELDSIPKLIVQQEQDEKEKSAHEGYGYGASTGTSYPPRLGPVRGHLKQLSFLEEEGEEEEEEEEDEEVTMF